MDDRAASDGRVVTVEASALQTQGLALVVEALRREVDHRRELEELVAHLRARLSAVSAEAKYARHCALHDELTGVANRTLFMDRLNHSLIEARRHSRHVALLFVDLDGFKQVNDLLGHNAGDQLLITVARRLSAALRAEDTVGRFGGDEFVCLFQDVPDRSHLARLAIKLGAAISSPCTVGGHRVKIRGSIGIAVSPRDGAVAEVLLKAADAAMYRAKISGQGHAFATPGAAQLPVEVNRASVG